MRAEHDKVFYLFVSSPATEKIIDALAPFRNDSVPLKVVAVAAID